MHRFRRGGGGGGETGGGGGGGAGGGGSGSTVAVWSEDAPRAGNQSTVPPFSSRRASRSACCRWRIRSRSSSRALCSASFLRRCSSRCLRSSSRAASFSALALAFSSAIRCFSARRWALASSRAARAASMELSFCSSVLGASGSSISSALSDAQAVMRARMEMMLRKPMVKRTEKTSRQSISTPDPNLERRGASPRVIRR